MILVLSIVLFLLLVLIAKKQGLKTFLCFYINYFLIIVYMILMGIGFNPIILSLITCLVPLSASLNKISFLFISIKWKKI